MTQAGESAGGAVDPGAVGAARKAFRGLLLRAKLRQGRSRVRAAFGPVVQASLAAGLSYAVAYYVFGHPYPFFAPVAVWLCLGFSLDRDVRKVGELAIGVAVGVGLGDLIVHFIGSGWWQIAVVLAASALVARFIDRGVLLATQAGVQAIVIVSLPATQTGGPGSRLIDALVGGAVALLVATLTPGDPRRRPRVLGDEATTELAQTLELLARGLRSGDVDDLDAALVRGRASEAALEEWQATATSAQELARVSPVGRKHRGELSEMERKAVLTDRAMRSVRVLARRSRSVAGPERDLRAVADVVDRFAAGTRVLAEAIGAGRDPVVAREILAETAAAADPRTVGVGDWQVQSLVVLLRSPIVDTLEAAGASPEQARAALHEL
jgi:uncharacterized membrane protein YgaE (UPF0421/DUF939 family)